MNMAAHDRSGTSASSGSPDSRSAGPDSPGAADAANSGRRPGLFTRLSSQFGSRGLTRRGPDMTDTGRRELLMHGVAGTATVLGVRPRRSEPGHEFWVRVQLDDHHPYETKVRQRVSTTDLEWMNPGDIIACRVDPGDHDRVVLFVPAPDEASRTNIAKILADGRRARATVLAATPIAADYTGRNDPVLRLDLELHAWDEPHPWLVRIIQPVPLAAIELVDLGRHLDVAFFTVDHGESVAVDWAASREH